VRFRLSTKALSWLVVLNLKLTIGPGHLVSKVKLNVCSFEGSSSLILSASSDIVGVDD
jgi:hypothetical protein